MKQVFLAAYEDSGSDKERKKEAETISLYDVIDYEESNKSKPPVQLGMHIGRPLSFDGHHFNEWKMYMEVFLQETNYDLWIIVNHGLIIPMKVNNNRDKSIKREE